MAARLMRMLFPSSSGVVGEDEATGGGGFGVDKVVDDEGLHQVAAAALSMAEVCRR
jgi:hypothetical protein